MIPLDNVTKENIKKHNPNWPQIPYHPYRKLIIGDSGSGKINSLFNLTNQQPDIDKIYLYGKDPYDVTYQVLTNKQDRTGLNNFNSSKTFNEYSMIWMIFIKILKNTIQIRNVKYGVFFKI